MSASEHEIGIGLLFSDDQNQEASKKKPGRKSVKKSDWSQPLRDIGATKETIDILEQKEFNCMGTLSCLSMEDMDVI